MKYSSSCMKPYLPLTASSSATRAAAISQAGSGTRSADVVGRSRGRCAPTRTSASLMPGRSMAPLRGGETLPKVILLGGPAGRVASFSAWRPDVRGGHGEAGKAEPLQDRAAHRRGVHLQVAVAPRRREPGPVADHGPVYPAPAPLRQGAAAPEAGKDG